MKKTWSKLLVILSYVISIGGSFAIVFEQHFYAKEHYFEMTAIIIIIFITIFGYKKLKAYCTETAMKPDGDLLVKIPRRPYLNSVFSFGSILLVFYFLWELLQYTETNAQALSGSTELVLYCIGAGGVLNLLSIYINKKATV